MPTNSIKTTAIALLASLPMVAWAMAATSATPPSGRVPAWSIGPSAIAPAEAGIGQRIADISVHDINGGVVNLSERVGERGVVVVVRDPDCPVSRQYGPRIVELASRYAQQGFDFVMIYPNVSIEPVLRAEDQATLNIPGLYVGKGSFALADVLGVSSTGDTFVLDADLRLRYRGAIDDQFGIGFTRPLPTRNYLRNALDDLVANRPIGSPATTAPGCHIDADPANDRWFDELPAGHIAS